MKYPDGADIHEELVKNEIDWHMPIITAITRRRLHSPETRAYVADHLQNTDDAFDFHLKNNTDSFLAEFAFRKAFQLKGKLGLEPDRKTGDVCGVEVRYTGVKDKRTGEYHGSLTIYPKDEDHRPYLLVVGKMPKYIIKGWIFGSHGKRIAPLKSIKYEDAPAHWVEQKDLRKQWEYLYIMARYGEDAPNTVSPEHEYDMDLAKEKIREIRKSLG